MINNAYMDNRQYYAVYVSATEEYHCWSVSPNTALTDTGWMIKQITKDGSGNITNIKYPQDANSVASNSYDFIANSYNTYTYGPA